MAGGQETADLARPRPSIGRRFAALMTVPVIVLAVGIVIAVRSSGSPAVQQTALPAPTTTTPASAASPADLSPAAALLAAAPALPTTVAPALIAPPAATTTVPEPAVPVAPAPVPNPTAAAPAPTLAQRGAEALALIHYPWEQTGYSIVFSGARPGMLGLTSNVTHTITIYVRDTQSSSAIARIIAHELGHAVDLRFTTDAERDRYRAIRGLGSVAWYPDCLQCSDYGYPAGDFAEVFASWLLGPGRFASLIGAPPTAGELAQLSPIFAAAAPDAAISYPLPS
jgi:hypothetical protein